MLQNYIKIAWRNLVRNKSHAFINIGGMAVALTVFLTIMLFVRHELSYDGFFADSDRIYRVLLAEGDDLSNLSVQLPEPIAGELKKLYPEVEYSVRLSGPHREVLLTGKNETYSAGWASAGTDFFNIFDFPFLYGNPQTALAEPNSLVITEDLAFRLFGEADVMGETIIQNANKEYTITGVLKNLPGNTHFNIQAFAYRNSYPTDRPPFSYWNMRMGQTYIKLSAADQADRLMQKLPSYVEEHINLPRGAIAEYRLILQPVTDIHLYPESRQGENSRVVYIRILILIAALILLVACINYINLATARSAERAREIGIRKTAGARRSQIIIQVTVESVIICAVAFLASLVLVELSRPLVRSYFDVELSSLFSFSAGWIGFLTGTFILVGLLSGSYAAIYLSSFRPSEILKGGGFQMGKSSSGLRKTLVVAQFSISTAIVIASLLISKQMDFIRTERLNGNDDQVMVIRNNSNSMQEKFGTFKQELLRSNDIISVTAGTLPNNISFRYGFRDSTGEVTTLHIFNVEYDYLETMGLKLVAGRDFDPMRPRDSTESVILNETAAREFGYEEANGQLINRPRGRLIGIVEDFHSHTLFDPIEPVAIKNMNGSGSRMYTMMVKLRKGNIASGIEYVQTVWNNFEPAYPLNYRFLDEIMDQDYRTELRLAKIFNVFSSFSILIACLGLFGLAAFSAQRRTKEIGIRKILGATVAGIIGLLSRDFILLVILGFTIAIPIAWYAMNRWLADFAYRIEIGAGVFLLAGGAALLIALATVSWQSVRAALANPVESLRSE